MWVELANTAIGMLFATHVGITAMASQFYGDDLSG